MQALTSALKAADSGGDWELGWPLLSLDDPDRKAVSIAADVATVAYAKEEKMPAVALGKAGKQKDDD